jgi:chemotaxis protein methyltransferase CheR
MRDSQMIAANTKLGIFAPNLKMSQMEFNEWRKYIYDLSGIYFQDNKKYLLESRLQRRMKYIGITSFNEYFNFIRFKPEGRNEIDYLMEAITINETYFFRNQAQLDVLVSKIIPDLIEKKRQLGNKKIKIWSAASSSGEEPYSVAMVINEFIKPYNNDFIFEIVGTDIDRNVIKTAQSGNYREYSIRNMPKHFLRKYFEFNGGSYALRPEIKKYVTFKVLNLYDEKAMRMMFNYDIIFCENVLIYFDTNSKVKVVSLLYDALNHGGYLFIGFSETLHGITRAFKIVNFPKTIGYLKE